MSPEDQAQFDLWLENCATPYEREELSYDEQVEHFILWLSGDGNCDLENFIHEQEFEQ